MLAEVEDTNVLMSFGNSVGAMIASMTDGRILAMNNEIFRITGRLRQEMTGKTLVELGWWQNSDNWEQIVEKVSQGEIVNEMAVSLPHSDNGRQTKASFLPTVYANQKCVLALFAEQVTSLENGEKTSEFNNRLKELFEHVHDIALTSDLTGNVVYANPAAERALGYSLTEMTKLQLIDLLPPDQFERAAIKFDSLIFSDNDIEREYELVGKQQRVPVRARSWLVYDQYKPILIQTVAMNLTESKQALESSKRSEARAFHLLKSAKEGIWEIDPEGQIIFANPAFAELLDYSFEELYGKKILTLIDSPGREALGEKIQSLGDEQSEQLGVDFVAKNGTVLRTEVSIHSVCEDKERLGLFGLVVDKTSAMQMGEKLARLEMRQTILLSILDAIRQNPSDIHFIFNATLAPILQFLNLKKGALWLSKPAGDDIIVADGLSESASMSIMDAWARISPQSSKTVSRSWAHQTGPLADVMRKEKVGASIFLPIEIHGDSQSALAVFSDESRNWDEAEVGFLEQVVVMLKSMADRAILLSGNRHNTDELETLNRLSTILRATRTGEEVLPTLMDEILQITGLEAGAIWLEDPAGGGLTQAISRGWFERSNLHSFKSTEGILGHVYATGRPYVAHELSSDPKTPNNARREIPPRWSGAFLPIRSVEKIVGVLVVSSRLPREVGPCDVRLLSTLAEVLGNTLQRGKLYESLDAAYESTLMAWARAYDIRAKETEGHTFHVAELAWKVGNAMGLGKKELGQLRRGALLHDIGKITLPDEVLFHDKPLTQSEFDVIRKHPEIARDLLAPIDALKSCLEVPYCHHEKWDGSGYPRGLEGEQIPLVARIFAVVDVWDALSSDRPYRPKWSPEKAVQYIREQAGRHFDPQVVQVFLRVVGR